MKRLVTYRTCFLLFCLMILFSGCGSFSGSPTPQSAVMPTQAPEDTPIATVSSVQTSLTPVASLPSQMPTLAPTTLPTLSSDEAQALILDLLENNGECRLPCWWGITPGETTWETALTFLSTFATRISAHDLPDQALIAEVFFTASNEVTPISLIEALISVKYGVIEEIRFSGFESLVYHLPQFLSAYGPPDEVWIDTWRKTLYPGRPFGLTLFYAKQGILASYSSLETEAEGGMIRGCLEQSPVLYLWDGRGDEMDFSEFAEAHGWDLKDPLHLPLEEATGMDIEMFYNTYKESGTAPCIETPYALWPEQ